MVIRQNKRAAALRQNGPQGADMPQSNQSLQDSYLNQLRKDKMPVVIYLTNGVRLKGVIKGFDNFCVLLKESTLQLIYKHAISTVLPERELDMSFKSDAQ